MIFNDNVDIIKFFRTLVHNLKPKASNQDVTLRFQSKIGQSNIKHYDADYIRKEILIFLNHILKYIPQNQKITILFDICKDSENCCILTITNTGVNLFRITEITASTRFNATAKSINPNSSEFMVEVPLLETEMTQVNEYNQKNSLTPYYLEIGKRLSAHFSKPNSLLSNSNKIGKKENVFIQRINNLLSSKLEDNTFTVDEFASTMAMSRTQLFRKTKALTNMSPSQYILYFRLQAAKELLETEDLDLNISDVCYSVGFMSKSHFTRSFQKQFGMLPSQIKQN